MLHEIAHHFHYYRLKFGTFRHVERNCGETFEVSIRKISPEDVFV